MAVRVIHDIENDNTVRFSTGIADLDWIYGDSMIDIQGKKYQVWGLPEGGLSLWGGQAGIGKTRIAVELCKRILPQHGTLKVDGQPRNRRVLFFQLEITLEQMRSRIGALPENAEEWICSDEKDLAKQMEIIAAIRPQLIIVDSINKIRQYKNGYGTDLIEERYRKAIQSIGSHVIFITHLNDKGTIKGGTNLPHMVDAVFLVYQDDDSNYVTFKSDSKNRFAPGGRWMWFVHNESGVEDITENWRTEGKEPYMKDIGSWTSMIEPIATMSVQDSVEPTGPFERLMNTKDPRNALQRLLDIQAPDS